MSDQKIDENFLKKVHLYTMHPDQVVREKGEALLPKLAQVWYDQFGNDEKSTSGVSKYLTKKTVEDLYGNSRVARGLTQFPTSEVMKNVWMYLLMNMVETSFGVYVNLAFLGFQQDLLSRKQEFYEAVVGFILTYTSSNYWADGYLKSLAVVFPFFMDDMNSVSLVVGVRKNVVSFSLVIVGDEYPNLSGYNVWKNHVKVLMEDLDELMLESDAFDNIIAKDVVVCGVPPQYSLFEVTRMLLDVRDGVRETFCKFFDLQAEKKELGYNAYGLLGNFQVLGEEHSVREAVSNWLTFYVSYLDGLVERMNQNYVDKTQGAIQLRNVMIFYLSILKSEQTGPYLLMVEKMEEAENELLKAVKNAKEENAVVVSPNSNIKKVEMKEVTAIEAKLLQDRSALSEYVDTISNFVAYHNSKKDELLKKNLLTFFVGDERLSTISYLFKHIPSQVQKKSSYGGKLMDALFFLMLLSYMFKKFSHMEVSPLLLHLDLVNTDSKRGDLSALMGKFLHAMMYSYETRGDINTESFLVFPISLYAEKDRHAVSILVSYLRNQITVDFIDTSTAGMRRLGKEEMGENEPFVKASKFLKRLRKTLKEKLGESLRLVSRRNPPLVKVNESCIMNFQMRGTCMYASLMVVALLIMNKQPYRDTICKELFDIRAKTNMCLYLNNGFNLQKQIVMLTRKELARWKTMNKTTYGVMDTEWGETGLKTREEINVIVVSHTMNTLFYSFKELANNSKVKEIFVHEGR